jgi:outer membrane protein assembly factor BamA
MQGRATASSLANGALRRAVGRASAVLRVVRFVATLGCLLSVVAPVKAQFLPGQAPPAIQPYAEAARALFGKPFVRAEVVVDRTLWGDVKPPELRSVRPGEPFSGTAARRLLDEALATGLFANGRLEAREEAGGVVVTVHVEPRKLVAAAELQVEGELERDDILRTADLAEGAELSVGDIARRRRRVLERLAESGYPNAQMTVETRPTDDPLRVLVLVNVDLGPPRVIERRHFYVVGADSREVAHVFKEYPVGPGQRFDESTLASADATLAEAVRAAGFHDAQVSHDVISWGGKVVLRVRIDTGPRVLVRFEGNDTFDHDALSGALTLEEDNDRSQGHLVTKLERFYRVRGFLDVEIETERRPLPERRAEFLVFRVREGQRVTVVSRAYPCLREQDVRALREGGPTSAKAIGSEIDSFLVEELPGDDLFRSPDPASVSAVIAGESERNAGTRPVPIDLEPAATYVAETYERAAAHVRDLYRNEGFLHASVGPVQVLRKRCRRGTQPDVCIPEPTPPLPLDACAYDASGLPLDVPPLDPVHTCRPDRARGVRCDSRIGLRIPVKLGPRTYLYDVAFRGVLSLSEQKLGRAAALPMGAPINMLKVEEAARRVVDAYKEEGFAYVDVKYSLEPSVDHSRARLRFDVREGERVLVREIVIRGNRRTKTSLIAARIALKVGEPYRTSLVAKTQQRVATLGVFSSVNITLDDPYVPQRQKVVIVEVAEPPSKFVEIRPGLSTGEGVRATLEFGDRNLFNYAVASTSRLTLAYLPTPFILDETFRRNVTNDIPGSSQTERDRLEARGFGEPGLAGRLVVRATQNFTLPDIGLGPLVRLSIDGALIRDLQRQFALRKFLFGAALIYTPVREVQLSFGPSVEQNEVVLFGAGTIRELAGALPPGSVLARALRVPDGTSLAVAQRVAVTWDRRDNAFNAHRGTYLATGIEHVQTFPIDADTQAASRGHFLRFTQTFSGYIPLPRRITLAGQVRLGQIVHLVSGSQTYPDRLFFLGGPESMRGFFQDAFVPRENILSCQAAVDAPPTATASADRPPDNRPREERLESCIRSAVNGGDLMVNPRFELRVPVRSPVELGLFVDSGNVWQRLESLDLRQLRFSPGIGLRIATPVGPVAVDYGFNLAPRPTEARPGALNLSIGVY